MSLREKYITLVFIIFLCIHVYAVSVKQASEVRIYALYSFAFLGERTVLGLNSNTTQGLKAVIWVCWSIMFLDPDLPHTFNRTLVINTLLEIFNVL